MKAYFGNTATVVEVVGYVYDGTETLAIVKFSNGGLKSVPLHKLVVQK